MPEVLAEISDRASAPSVTQGTPLPTTRQGLFFFFFFFFFFKTALPRFQSLALHLYVRVPSVLLFISQMLIFSFALPLFSSSLNTFV